MRDGQVCASLQRKQSLSNFKMKSTAHNKLKKVKNKQSETIELLLHIKW